MSFQGISIRLALIAADSAMALILLHRLPADDDWIIDAALPIPGYLVTSLAKSDPLTVLKTLLQQFGLFVVVGNVIDKLIMGASIPTVPGAEHTQMVEIINPFNHPFVANSLVRPTASQIDCTLVFALDMAEYRKQLGIREPSVSETNVSITPAFRGQITIFDLLNSQGTLVFSMASDQTAKEGLLFRVTAPGYLFESKLVGGRLVLQRNSHVVTSPARVVPKKNRVLNITWFITWSPDSLGIDEYVKYDKAKTRTRSNRISTPLSLPPNELVEWARRQRVAAVTVYEDQSEFYQTILEALQAIQDKIDEIGMSNPFWDITYQGSKICARSPKKEIDIHPTLHGLLRDIALAKNLEITQEYPVAGGLLDFLLSGVLKIGQIEHVCVEVKLAHSNDLDDGLLRQLPAYMRAKGCSQGVYLVLWAKGDRFREPVRFKDTTALQLELQGKLIASGLRDIRVLCIDVHPRVSPSRRQAQR